MLGCMSHSDIYLRVARHLARRAAVGLSSTAVLVALLLAALALGSSLPAAAQQPSSEPSYGATLSSTTKTAPSDAALLASINTESRWATGLYVASVVGMVGGLTSELFAVVAWFDCVGEEFRVDAPSSCGVAGGLAVTGAVLGAVGVVLLPIAIGLDVDSHSRRDGLTRGATARISVGPGGLLVSGTF